MRHIARLFPADNGPLTVWEKPRADRKYAIGVDTASGSRDGDFCAAEVIDCETCSQVAEFHTKLDPIPFGQECALLGQYYNEAFLGFEVYPAAHGLAAQNAAIDLGYRNFYREVTFDRVEQRTSERIGWRTDGRTKPLMVNRIRLAMLDKYAVRSAKLLREIRGMKFDDNHRVYTDTHDDLHDAYGIALMVRDTAYRRGQVQAPPPKRSTWNELHWDRWEASTGGAIDEAKAETPLYDGR